MNFKKFFNMKALLIVLAAVVCLSTGVSMEVQAANGNPYDYCNVITPKYGYLEATQQVNVRALPTSNSAKLGVLNKRDVITVTGQTDTDWFQITYKNQVAYVYGYYFTRTAGTNTRAQYMEEFPSNMDQSVLLNFHSDLGIRQFNAYLVQKSRNNVALYGPTSDSDSTADDWGTSTYSPAFISVIDNSGIQNEHDPLTKFVAVTESYIRYLKTNYIDKNVPISGEESTIYYNILMNSLGLDAYQVWVSQEYCSAISTSHVYSHVVVDGMDFYCDPLWVAKGYDRARFLYNSWENIIHYDCHYGGDIWAGGLDFLYAHQYSYQMRVPEKK